MKPPEDLLSDILDPNRMFEARWSAYAVETKDGRTLSGLIQSETPDAVVLAMMGGAKETISRSAIKDMKSLDRTLMPDGLEAAITKEQMSDLIAFLRSADAPHPLKNESGRGRPLSGLEAAITKEQMGDLIAFLLGK